MPLTLAQMLALLPDNTTGSISEEDMRDVVTAIVRGQRAPYSVDDPEDVWWEGGDLDDFTAVNPSGSHTPTEIDGRLSITFASQNGNHFGARLKARTFAVGDIFATGIKTMGGQNYTMAGLVFTDGTGVGANVAGGFVYWGDNLLHLATLEGTLNAINSFPTNMTDMAGHAAGTIYLRFQYAASNSFKVFWSADGLNWTDFGNAAFSKTLTPTHFGPAFSRYGGGAALSVATFDPLCKVA